MTRPLHVRSRRAFTMLEAMLATSLLLIVVVALTHAVTAGQQHALEAHLRISGTLAADDLMGRLVAEPYAQLSTWHNFKEDPGSITLEGGTTPGTMDLVGRSVTVTTKIEGVTGPGVTVEGAEIKVRSFDAANRTLIELVHFVPEPGP